MSDGWFDRTYRSRETPPAELDASVLAAARRATRRWTLPAVAAGALTIVAAAVLGFLITSHEFHVPTEEAPLVDSPADGDGFRIDVVQPSGEREPLRPPTELAFPQTLREPGGIRPADPQAETEGSRAVRPTSPELDCRRSALVGALGGPERRDLVQICSGDGTLYVDVFWDGEPACPSRLELNAPSGVSVRLDGSDLLVAQRRYRCQDGKWIASTWKRSGDPTTRPRQ